ncbi:MAG: hypothetical protein LQ338_003463 [Usnochroma carphineum]|nr:MAG: hypothetical protein LQ338_003463 [Usnochroma carphineum]
MASCTFWSLDSQERHKPTKKRIPLILDQVKHAERKVFPRNEAFDFDTELKKRSTELMVVLDAIETATDPVVVAYAVYNFTPQAVLLHKVCVLEKYRRQGIAKKLLLSQHRRLALRGCSKVQLWVDEGRIPARRLYENIGFEEVGRVEDYYSPNRTALRMVLQL